MNKSFFKILPHLCSALAIALAVIIYVDGRNPMMMFLSSTPSKVFLYVLVVLVLVLSFHTIFKDHFDK